MMSSRIRLTTDEQQELNALVSRSGCGVQTDPCGILLMSDESRSDGGMKDAITSALPTVERQGGGGRVCAESATASASAGRRRSRYSRYQLVFIARMSVY